MSCTGPEAGCDCGCCEGAERRAPRRIENRAGLGAIAYRSGSYAHYRASMVAKLSSSRHPALARLGTRRPDDFTIALIDAFAMTADVLTFYQERLANEAFLGTAIERESIGELAKLIGYQLSRGVSAAADVVFTVDAPPVLPPTAPEPVAVADPQSVVIEAGTKIQSVPGQDEHPQLFETGETIEGRAELNCMLPLRHVDQNLAVGASGMVLAGVGLRLAAGDVVLIVSSAAREIVHLNRVSEDAARVLTRIEWSTPLGTSFNTAPGFSVHVLRAQASVFGHNAVSWPALSTAAKADYLHLTDEQYRVLAASDSAVGAQWPGFTIFAPGAEIIVQPDPEIVAADVQAVLSATVETADRLANLASGAARQAVPGTAIDVARTVGEILMTLPQALASLNLQDAFSTDTAAIGDAVTRLVTDLLPSGTPLTSVPSPSGLDLAEIAESLQKLFDQDSATATRLNGVIDALNQIVSYAELGTNAAALAEALSPVNLLNQVVSEVTTALAPLGASAGQLGGSLEHVRQTLSEAAVTNAMSQFVKGLAETAVQTGLVDDATSLGDLVRYATSVADQAVRHAPGANLVETFNEFVVEMDAAAASGVQGKQTFDRLVDLGSAFADTTLAAGAAGGVIALHPALAPLLVLDIATAGAAQSAATAFSNAIHGAVDRALEPTHVPQPRRHAGYAAQGGRIDLDRVYPEARAGGWVVLAKPGLERAFRVTGVARTSRAQFLITLTVTRLALSGEGLEDFEHDVRDTTVWLQSDPLSAARVPWDVPVAGKKLLLDRVVPGLIKGRKLLVTGTSAATGAATGETAIVEAARKLGLTELSDGTQVTELELEAPLESEYLRADARIFGNVAAATHGETTFETLGSGDATRSFQSFALKQAPLTHVSASSELGAATTLKVLVNDVQWREVPFLHGQAADARVYTTRIDAEGKLVVRFGDGVSGARLPTGTNNIRAEYRKGTGIAGLVRKAQLSQLMTRPLGLKDAVNPLPAEGAADPERREDARRNAPLTVLTLGRAVSLRDYEDYANAFAGIAKAQAAWLWDGTQRVILITVAGSGGAALEERGTTITNLRDALRKFGDPFVPFHVMSFRGPRFRVGVRLGLVADAVAHPVLSEAERRLRERYSFERCRFGDPVHLSEIVRVLHETPGIAAVDVDRLYRDDEPVPGALQPRLLADRAMLDPQGSPTAAELLLLHSDPFDQLELMT